MPAVKMIASTPDIRAAYEPIYLWILSANTSSANSARLFSPAAASISLKSLENPDNAKRPLCLFKPWTTSSALLPVFSIMYGIRAESMLPDRVPMVTPSNGVQPLQLHPRYLLNRWKIPTMLQGLFVYSKHGQLHLRFCPFLP